MVAIWNDSFVFSGSGGRRELYTAHDYAQLISIADLTVAERAEAVKGTITLLDPLRAGGSIASEGELEVTRLAVAASARRQGIARVLLACAHGEAVRRGARALVLWSLPSQIEAHDLYRSLGYERRADRRPASPQGDERLVYRLALRRSGRSLAARRSRV